MAYAALNNFHAAMHGINGGLMHRPEIPASAYSSHSLGFLSPAEAFLSI
jgi:hypothetical protein